MIPGKPNQSKGRRSNRTLEEMLTKYNAFLRANPDWPKVAEEFYLRQETFICREPERDPTSTGQPDFCKSESWLRPVPTLTIPFGE